MSKFDSSQLRKLVANYRKRAEAEPDQRRARLFAEISDDMDAEALTMESGGSEIELIPS